MCRLVAVVTVALVNVGFVDSLEMHWPADLARSHLWSPG